MDREILFRGKKEHDGKWIRGYYFFYYDILPRNPELDGSYIVNRSGKYFKVDPKTVGQFTGKYDKNGKKIFEGDILCEGFNPIYQSVKTSTVCFEDGSFYFKYRNNDELSFVLNEWNASQREVIGNIHDNPELLGGEDAKN